MVLVKLIAAPAAAPPALVGSRVIPAAKVTGPVRVIAPPALVIFPPKEVAEEV